MKKTTFGLIQTGKALVMGATLLLGGVIFFHANWLAYATDPSRIPETRISSTLGQRGEKIMSFTQLDEHQCVGALSIVAEDGSSEVDINGQKFSMQHDAPRQVIEAMCGTVRAPIDVRFVENVARPS